MFNSVEKIFSCSTVWRRYFPDIPLKKLALCCGIHATFDKRTCAHHCIKLSHIYDHPIFITSTKENTFICVPSCRRGVIHLVRAADHQTEPNSTRDKIKGLPPPTSVRPKEIFTFRLKPKGHRKGGPNFGRYRYNVRYTKRGRKRLIFHQNSHRKRLFGCKNAFWP